MATRKIETPAFLVLGAAKSGTTALYTQLAQHPQVTVGSYPVLGQPDFRVKVAIESRDGEAVARACQALVARLPPGTTSPREMA